MSNDPKAAKVKVVMTSYMTGNDFSHAPGDVVEFDKAEAERVVSVGGGKLYVETKPEAEAKG